MARAAPQPGKTFDHVASGGPGTRRGLWFHRPLEKPLEAFLVSAGVVALGEMGDKTQLLAILLAARFRKPWPIVAGILVATLANHAGAAAIGGWIARAVDPDVLRWVIGFSFIAMAAWVLVPDKADGVDAAVPARYGVVATTAVSFFVAEMGDKTQLATVALAARYPDLLAVVVGTTLGMLLANVPAVLLGHQIARRVSLRLVHAVAAGLFALIGVLALVGGHRLA